MTRRERLERKAERRRDWAASAEHKSARAFEGARRIADGIPLGQPILVGHHSERHARRDQERIHNSMSKACDLADKAKDHEAKAAGLEAQLERSIFSDDDNAIEALEAKAAGIEAEAERCKAQNAAFRKAPGADGAAKLAALVRQGDMTQAEALDVARLWAVCPYHAKQPHPSYHLTNLRANARRCRERIKAIQRQAAQVEKAEQAEGGILVEKVGEDYARVTFPDYPGREIVAALKAAGFHWSRPSWYGKADALPKEIQTTQAL